MKKALNLAISAGFILATTLAVSCSSDDGENPLAQNIVNGDPVTYQGETYKTVVIGTQTWFARNLNYEVEGSACYNNQTSNCDTYGRLYTWDMAKTACPNGWKLPSTEDWEKLLSFINSDKKCPTPCDAKYLKSTSGWSSGNGLDTYGFSALPGGVNSAGNFGDVGEYGYWWSATDLEYINEAWLRIMSYGNEYASLNYYYKSDLLSVRCVKN